MNFTVSNVTSNEMGTKLLNYVNKYPNINNQLPNLTARL